MRAIAWLIVKLSGLFVKLYHLLLNAIRRFDRAMRKRYRPKHLALIAVLVIAITASITLFVPPYLGLSNDGSICRCAGGYQGLSRLTRLIQALSSTIMSVSIMSARPRFRPVQRRWFSGYWYAQRSSSTNW